MLELRDVTVVYGQGTAMRTTALADVSLSVASGESVTVVGSNGAGKSSLIGVVSGAIRPTRGRVLIDGTDVTSAPDYRRAGHIARVFDNPSTGTVPQLSIEDNMALAMARGTRRGLRWAVTRKRRERMRERLAQLGLGLESRLGSPAAALSAGQRQSLTLVMAALRRPDILLLDEHLAALDPHTQLRVLDLTIDLVSEMGCTSIMVTHNMEHAIKVGDRLLVMGRGEVITSYEGRAKTDLTVQSLIDDITARGEEVSDRSTLVAPDAPRRPGNRP